MKWLKLFLVVELLALTAYTVLVIQDQGLNLLPHFFGAIAEVNWQGQFNMDFLIVLALSGIWVSWRHGHSAAGVVLGLCAATGGVMFLCVYLLVQIARCGGDVKALLLGQQAARV